MIDRLRELEAVARRLEPGAEERGGVRDEVVAYSEAFLERLPEGKMFHPELPERWTLLDSPFQDDPTPIDDLLKGLAVEVDTPGINPASAGHIGYIPGGGLYYSSLGDYLAAVTNRYAGVFFGSPGAVRMENALIAWMADLVGYPATAGGNHASGGSIANLTAVIAAREAHGIRARDVERAVVYLSAHTHHCLDKAFRIAGLQDCVVRRVPLDERYRMVPAEIARMIEADRRAGLRPWMLIGSAGTTDVGAVDPLHDLAHIAATEQLWFHIDAAYGGFFILTEHGKRLFKGIERSDSLVLDPHKGLFLPYGLGTVLVRDGGKLLSAFTHEAHYMQDTRIAIEDISPADVSPELSKHFRGMRLWLPLKLHGLAPFRAALEEKLLLARYFHGKVKELGFEVGPEPDLTVVTFRYVPEVQDADELNKRLLAFLHKDGRVYISSTVIDGRFTLRAAILSFRTHRETVDVLLEMLRNGLEAML